MVSTAVPHLVQSIAGIGTPQTRWREMHQSGRLAIMPSMRAWPHDGIQRVSRDRLEGALAELLRVHRDEPLRRREEDDRVVAAPAVRVLMLEILAIPEAAALLERRFDLRIRVPHLQAGEELDRFVVMAAGVERRVDLEAVTHAGLVVVGAVAGRGVDGAGAGIERHVVAEHAERIAFVERMTEHQPLHRLAVERREQAGRSACRSSCRPFRRDPSR